jgi:hypothetical protein
MKENASVGMSQAVRRRSDVALRGARAGLVYIEAMVSCGVLAILLAATGFTFALFSAKLDTLYAARQGAWERAMPGCPWQSACQRPRSSRVAQTTRASPFEASWAARLETRTIVSCNEPAREDDSLKDVLRTFQTELAKTGPRTVLVIGLTSMLTAIVSAAQLSQQAARCLWRSVEQSPLVEAVRPSIQAAFEHALRLIH